eukprot:2369338-Rhodomonas_salina.1
MCEGGSGSRHGPGQGLWHVLLGPETRHLRALRTLVHARAVHSDHPKLQAPVPDLPDCHREDHPGLPLRQRNLGTGKMG